MRSDFLGDESFFDESSLSSLGSLRMLLSRGGVLGRMIILTGSSLDCSMGGRLESRPWFSGVAVETRLGRIKISMNEGKK